MNLCHRCGKKPIYQGKRVYIHPNYICHATLCLQCRSEIAKKSRRKPLFYKSSDGYSHVLTENGYRAEHRLVMEQKLGRSLKKKEVVHHKDGNRSNNNPENLELWLRDHPYGIRASDLICPHCGKHYVVS